MAIKKSHWSVVECLVGWGALLNLVDIGGNTPLHSVITSKSVISPESPQIKQVNLSLVHSDFEYCLFIHIMITAVGMGRALSGCWREGSKGLHCSGLLPGAGGSRLVKC